VPNLQRLHATEPWEWPEDTADLLLTVLKNPAASEKDCLLAAEMAGDLTVVNDDLVDALLAIATRSGDSLPLRCAALRALGPVLDDADMQEEGFLDALPVTDKKIDAIRDTLQALHDGCGHPDELRRAALETSVRWPEEWHADAIREALACHWTLTAVFCMRYVEGFSEDIMQALNGGSPEIRGQALLAAAAWEVQEAWPHVLAVLAQNSSDADTLIAAIEAAASLRPDQAEVFLRPFTRHRNERVAAAAEDAIATADLGEP